MTEFEQQVAEALAAIHGPPDGDPILSQTRAAWLAPHVAAAIEAAMIGSHRCTLSHGHQPNRIEGQDDAIAALKGDGSSFFARLLEEESHHA